MAEYNIDSIVMPNGEAQEITAIVMPNGDEYTFSGGTTPTGNINIDHAGVTDVTDYATATVPSGTISNISINTTAFDASVDSSGRVAVELDEVYSATPISQNGYVETTDSINVFVYGTKSIQLSTQAATAITPTESQQTAVTAGKYTTGAVTVNAIPSNYVGSGVTQRSSTDLTASGATVTAPAGYYANNATKTVASGTATPAATISGTAATVTTGTNTLTLSKTVSNTPQVSAGYVSSGTAGNSSVSLTANVTTQAAQTIYPSSSDQTINSGRYLTGNQTIKAVTTTNLTADNIKSGVVVQVGDSADADRVLSVTGTYTGGGGSSDVAMGTLTVASNVNTSASTAITTTSAIGFTPTKFLFYRSDRAATSNHVNQASFVTLGSSYYVRTMTRYSNNALSTSGNANNWTTQTAGYLYFNNNTVYFRSSSSYILSAGTWYWVAVK